MQQAHTHSTPLGWSVTLHAYADFAQFELLAAPPRLRHPQQPHVIKPDGKVPPSELQNFFDYQQEKNNLLVLTGQDSHMADAVEDRLREFYAIEQIHKRLKAGDTLFEEARDRMEEAEDRFEKALSAAYNRVYFPSVDDLDGREFLAPVTIDNGLKLGKGDQSAEAQIESLLASPRANYKLAADLAENFNEYFAMAEEFDGIVEVNETEKPNAPIGAVFKASFSVPHIH